MEVYRLDLEEGPPTLLIEWEDRAPLLVLQRDQPPSECWHLPALAERLVTRESVIQEALQALEKLKLSATARTAVETMLEQMAE